MPFILPGTFSQPNGIYYVKINNGFFTSLRNEPMLGVSDKSWTFSTKPFKPTQHSEKIDAVIKLNKEGSEIFRKSNEAEYFQTFIKELSAIVPVDPSQI